jgi:hypothetical protein
MLFFDRSPAIHSYLFAVFVAVTVSMALGYMIYRTNPSACYDSPCLLPLLLMILPPFAVPVLAVLFAINRRRKTSIPDGWLPTIMISGFAVQIAFSVYALSASEPGFRNIFFSELLSVPQGLFVGLLVGAVFWVALYASAQKSGRI